MYKVTTPQGESYLTEKVNYIRVHTSGVYLLTDAGRAEGVAYRGTPYLFSDGAAVCEVDAGETLNPIIDLIHTETTQSDKLGQNWVETYVGDVLVRKEYVAQENPVGTSPENPIEYAEGVPLINNAYYRKDGKLYVYMDGWVEWTE